MEVRWRPTSRILQAMLSSAFSSDSMRVLCAVRQYARVLAMVGLCVGLFFATGALQAQQPGGAADQKFTITGSVVNETTGEPIPRAMVTLIGSPMRYAFSDSSGAFLIDTVPPGRYSISAQKPGYFGPQERASARAMQTVDVGPATDSIIIKLAPESILFGRLTDANGQPVESVSVRLVERVLRNGMGHFESRNSTSSDEDGSYRFANLAPGTYYISAGPDLPRREALFREPEAPRTGWPALYYPQAPDISSAAPIHLTAGQQMQADLVMNRVPLYRISGIVSGFLPGTGVALQVLNAAGDFIGVGAHVRQPSGEFEIHLPAGTYRLKAFSQSDEQQMRADVRLTVEKDLNQLQLALQPAVSIPIHARMEDRSDNPGQMGRSHVSVMGKSAYDAPPVTVHLVAVEPGGSDVYSTNGGTQGNRMLSLRTIEPGRYTAEMNAFGGWYVESAQCGNSNPLTEDLIVSAGTSCSLELTLRNDGGSLNAKVEASGSPIQGMALLVAARGRGTPRSIPFYTGDASRPQITIDGVAPGEYLLYAFDSPEGVEYSNPEVLRSYSAQATAVTITPNQTTKITAQLIKTGADTE